LAATRRHADGRQCRRLHRRRNPARAVTGTNLVNADKGYDSNAIRHQSGERGCPILYRNRNAIERMFCRIKDLMRIATRHDRNATKAPASTDSNAPPFKSFRQSFPAPQS
jgi:transposase